MKYRIHLPIIFCLVLFSACGQPNVDQTIELKAAADVARPGERVIIDEKGDKIKLKLPDSEGMPLPLAETSEPESKPEAESTPVVADGASIPIQKKSDKIYTPAPTPHYLSAGKTWEKHFVSDTAEIPVNAFRAFYFNDKKPTEVVHTEVVDHPALQDSEFGGFHGIDPYDFGAYYVGYFDFSSPASREINVDLSWADCRVIIDGNLIYSSAKAPSVSAPGVYSHDSSGSTRYEFSPGRHKIEIEYVNNWHTIGFSIAFLEPYIVYSQEELVAELKKTADAEYWYAGVYESDDSSNDIHITLKPSQKPVFLFLSSFSAVDWVFSEMKETNLKAVVLPAGRSAGTVAGLPEHVAVYHLDDMPWAYQILPDCSMGRCDGTGFQKLIPFVLKLKPNFFTGFSGAYGVKEITIPAEVLDLQDYERISNELLELINRTKEEDPYDNQTADVFPITNE